jgi:ribokinase
MPAIVTLGSLCIDNVYRVPALVGAGETAASLSHQVFAGGKGLNQSLAAARAGAAVAHVGAVGPDGVFLIDTLREAGVDTAHIRMLQGERSGHAVIQVDDKGRNAIVIAGGANRALTDMDVAAALDALDPGGWLLLQNEINDLPGVLDAARGRRARIAFNLAPADHHIADYDLSGVALIIVNEIEAAALSGEREPARALAELTRAHAQADIVLTEGEAGLRYAGPSGHGQMPAFAVRTVDETAAGDAFIGYLIAALAAELDFVAALAHASAAGAMAVTTEGAAASIPFAADVAAFVSARESRS